MNPQVDRLLVIGLGLIGGSFALGLKQRGCCRTVIGYNRNQDTLDKGLRLGIIDEAATDLEAAVRSADVIMLAVPVKVMESVMAQISPWLRSDTILTDAGSAKGNVVRAAEQVFGEIPPLFVPGHPIAGSEKSGVTAAKSDLYERHKVILTPLAQTDRNALKLIHSLWEALGAEVHHMDVPRHDEVLAATSHLPHLLAFSLVNTLANDRENRDIFRYAAGGFRDFTRIAASDPIMWHDIFLANRDATLKVLDEFTDGLAELRDAVARSDGEAMLGVFTRAKSARDHFTKILSGTAYSLPMNDNVIFKVQPGGKVQGQIRVAGDKSMSHRSIMLGALAEGVTDVEGFLEGEDALATLQAFRDMGVVIEGPTQGRVRIHGVGMQGLKQPPGPLYLGNSGTAMRLFAGLLAGQDFDTELTGDESLSKRPMERVAEPLRQMGAWIVTGPEGCPPIKIVGGQSLKGIDYQMPMASAQVKSCVLLAGLYSDGETSTTEPAPTRDHTERMLTGFGYPVECDGATARVQGGGKMTAAKIDVPADISSAAFFMVAASIAPGSDLLLEHVGINPTRIGVINILRQMGADLTLSNERDVGGEPVADIRIRYAPLKGIQIPEDQVPLAIDEFPVLFIAAACAEGTTILTGAEELRVKESDRIQAMVDGLSALGVQVEGTPDGAIIQGGGLQGGRVNSLGDHRIAMAFAVAGLRAEGEIVIDDCANVATSFPNFVELAKQVGLNLRIGG
ncbi:bifunctional prephenate dehydrogenase/3-phosphoshikimate 1-carboxyvinyltransferase [Motiliproteus coralliicola]|uniref:3-phosphoshikimate 1-carboxyvinyltransferase n=1 Tax=Motiliproteus coralliicola TaxID=2283196 RepID=A0A369WMQ9_9GAMM|nr:bifunctional prephenate dehydrogenase/3-phosphoshikimate 1-carboxyvinyltransferase [Motiliproteus coralliicola]RDE23002.1 bifunctional prephenate dehydrogenase/3-phosphoshikimate 1-carboxyvinyltransferase [Motiliproteus coralliicola]